MCVYTVCVYVWMGKKRQVASNGWDWPVICAARECHEQVRRSYNTIHGTQDAEEVSTVHRPRVRIATS